MDLSMMPYGETGRSKVDRERELKAVDLVANGVGGGEKYRECMKNHAAAIGGQVYDGCGEFMPGGEEGTLEALKCAACGCHRNFHRRAGFSFVDPSRPLLLKAAPPSSVFPVFLPPPPHPMPLRFHSIRPPPPPPTPLQPTAYQVDRSRVGSETPPPAAAVASEGPRGAARKRYRTKFTQEQKEKMQAFAEKLGWRIQKHDVVALEEFCVEVGVKRHVLKVWMHNNKNHLSSSSSSASAAAVATAPKPDATSAPPIRV